MASTFIFAHTKIIFYKSFLILKTATSIWLYFEWKICKNHNRLLHFLFNLLTDKITRSR